MIDLILACAAFVGTHLMMSHPLRAAMVAKLGGNGFLGVYSLVSFATFGWVVMAFRAAPAGATLWSLDNGGWAAATVLMWAGSVLFAGSLVGNPAAPDPNAAALLSRPATGVFGITRHPMMWGFALWGIVHILVAPYAANIVLCAAMIALALVGARGQDAKKEVLMGEGWKGWEARTSYLPFARQMRGQARWADAVPALPHLLIGTAIWLGASWAHGGIGAGIWRWMQ